MAISTLLAGELLNSVGELENVRVLGSVNIDGTTHLYAGVNGAQISRFEVIAGVPQFVETISLPPEMTSSGSVNVVRAGGLEYLLVAGFTSGADLEGGLAVYEIQADGGLTQKDFIEGADDTDFMLASDEAITSATIGDKTFVFTLDIYDDGLSVFELGTDGQLTHVETLLDDATVGLTGAAELSIAQIGGNTILIVTDFSEDSITTFLVANDGTVTVADHVVDTADTPITDGYAHQVVTVSGRTFFIFSESLGDRIHTYEVGFDGTLSYVSSIVSEQNGAPDLTQVNDIDSIVLGGRTYLATTDSNTLAPLHNVEGHIWRVEFDGSLTLLETFVDGVDAFNLTIPTGVDLTFIDGAAYALFSSSFDDSLTSFQLNFPFAIAYQGETYDLAETLGDAVSVAVTGATVSQGFTGLYDADPEIVQVRQDLLTIDLLSDTGVIFELDGFARTFTTTGDGDVTVRGSSARGEDITTGGGSDLVFGYAGDDTLKGGDGADVLAGGLGLDTIFGNEGADQIRGGAKGDILNAGKGHDFVYGGGGWDFIYGGKGKDELHGGSGKDTMSGGDSADTIYGDSGDDSISGGASDDFLYGGSLNENAISSTISGDDTIFGGKGADSIEGSGGNDTLHGDDGDDEIGMGVGNDTGYGGEGDDTLYGDNNDDVLFGGDHNDSLDGGDGVDRLFGNEGEDILGGRDSNDELFGGKGNDTLNGGGDDDSLFGGKGDDTLIGSLGVDTLTGDTGNDHFDFSNEFGIATIADFTVGDDVLNFGFADRGYADAQALLDAVATETGGNVEIDFGEGGALIILNITEADLLNNIIG